MSKIIKYRCITYFPLEEKDFFSGHTLKELKKKAGEDYDNSTTVVYKSKWKNGKFVKWVLVK